MCVDVCFGAQLYHSPVWRLEDSFRKWDSLLRLWAMGMEPGCQAHVTSTLEMSHLASLSMAFP